MRIPAEVFLPRFGLPELQRRAHSICWAWAQASESWVWVFGQVVGSKPVPPPLVKGLRRGGASSRPGLLGPSLCRPPGATEKVVSCLRRSCSIWRGVAARVEVETFPGTAKRRLLLARPQSPVADPPTTASHRPRSNPGWRHHRDHRACRSSRRPWPAPRPRRRFSPTAQSRPHVHSSKSTPLVITPPNSRQSRLAGNRRETGGQAAIGPCLDPHPRRRFAPTSKSMPGPHPGPRSGVKIPSSRHPQFRGGPPISPMRRRAPPANSLHAHPAPRARRGRAGSAAKEVLASQAASVLAGSVDPQHPHIAGGRAAAGVGDDLVQHPVAAGAG